MRSARTLLSGLALSTLLAGAALAAAEPEPSEASADPSAVTAPESGTSEAASGEGAQASDAPEQSEAAEATEDAGETGAGDQSTASGQESEPAAVAAEGQPESTEPEPAQAADTDSASQPATAATEAKADDSDEPGSAEARPGQAAAQSEASTGTSASTAVADPVTGDAGESQAEQATAADSPAEPDAPASAAAADPAVDDAAEPAPVAAEAQPEQPTDTVAAEPIIEVSKFEPELLRLISEAEDISDAEREALTAFYQGRGDDLLWITGGAFSARAESAMAEIRQADDWGLEASAFELPAKPQSNDPAEVAAVELKLSLAVLKYAKHARGGRMDPRQLSNYIDREPPLLAPADVLAGIATADAADSYLRGLHPQHPQFEKLRQAWLDLKGGKLPVEDAEEDVAPKSSAGKKSKKADSDEAKMRKLLHNMEQWRWMPEDLGQFYVWANVPEFTLRVMKDGKAIHTERLIVGKRDTQTPIFSDEMETIVFHPYWGVPNSIKVKELLPGLVRGSNVLARNDLRIQYRGRDIDPSRVDWARTDIRNFHVYQPPSSRNVLGVVKFLFPNKHAVYMHDTPTKHLFKASQRLFSHGCMRVRDPLKFAEILLAHDKGWDAGRITGLVKRGPQNNHVTIDSKIPVHITYFTAWVDEKGVVKTWSDVYGHEKRIQMGLEGKAHLIAKKKEDLGAVRAEVVGRLAETGPTWSAPSSSRQPDWVRRVFGN